MKSRSVLGADTFDLCAHRHETFGQIRDLRLARGILDQRFATGEHGRHQCIFGSADGYEGEGDAPAP